MQDIGGFHLHLLVFTLVYQFNSRIGILVHSSFANDQFIRSSAIFQHHFKICLFYIKNNVTFILICFAVLKWDECLSAQLPFELPVQKPVQLILELESNSLEQNENELEFELSRIKMKQPLSRILIEKAWRLEFEFQSLNSTTEITFLFVCPFRFGAKSLLFSSLLTVFPIHK